MEASLAEPISDCTRILAHDKYMIDYGMTRDNSMSLADGVIHRFSCKGSTVLPSPHFVRQRLPPYQAWIIGQIHKTEAFYAHRIVESENATNCYVVTLKCPNTSRDRGRLFFGKQVAALKDIIRRDGAHDVQVVLTVDAMTMWNGGNWAFCCDQHMKMLVALKRDDDFRGKKHTYTAWLEAFAVVGEEDIDPYHCIQIPTIFSSRVLGGPISSEMNHDLNDENTAYFLDPRGPRPMPAESRLILLRADAVSLCTLLHGPLFLPSLYGERTVSSIKIHPGMVVRKKHSLCTGIAFLRSMRQRRPRGAQYELVDALCYSMLEPKTSQDVRPLVEVTIHTIGPEVCGHSKVSADICTSENNPALLDSGLCRASGPTVIIYLDMVIEAQPSLITERRSRTSSAMILRGLAEDMDTVEYRYDTGHCGEYDMDMNTIQIFRIHIILWPALLFTCGGSSFDTRTEEDQIVVLQVEVRKRLQENRASFNPEHWFRFNVQPELGSVTVDPDMTRVSNKNQAVGQLLRSSMRFSGERSSRAKVWQRKRLDSESRFENAIDVGVFCGHMKTLPASEISATLSEFLRFAPTVDYF
ncbi:hypothetical protein DFH06DRAFT_1438103 [Mycena polygramma]|nr:hypothetical protein DFH06DRAFT_1438103 [Mycena polygramma]